MAARLIHQPGWMLFETLWEGAGKEHLRAKLNVVDTVLFGEFGPGKWLGTDNEGYLVQRRLPDKPSEGEPAMYWQSWLLRCFDIIRTQFSSYIEKHGNEGDGFAVIWYVDNKQEVATLDGLQAIFDDGTAISAKEIGAIQAYTPAQGERPSWFRRKKIRLGTDKLRQNAWGEWQDGNVVNVDDLLEKDFPDRSGPLEVNIPIDGITKRLAMYCQDSYGLPQIELNDIESIIDEGFTASNPERAGSIDSESDEESALDPFRLPRSKIQVISLQVTYLISAQGYAAGTLWLSHCTQMIISHVRQPQEHDEELISRKMLKTLASRVSPRA